MSKSFSREAWKENLSQSYQRMRGWLAGRAPEAGLMGYGALTTFTLWPLVEAVTVAAQQGQHPMMAVGAIVGGIGSNLLASQIQAWYDRTQAGEPITEEDVLLWLQEHIGEQNDLQAGLDKILQELEAIQQATAVLPTDMQAQFLTQLQQDLEKLGSLERFQPIINQTITQNKGIAISSVGPFQVQDIINIQGDVIYYQPSPLDPNALRKYLELILRENSTLPLTVLDQKTADPTNRQENMNLARVYVSLNTTRQQTISRSERGKDVPEFGREREEQIPLSALGAAGQYQYMVMTGDPGGGKSTFVSHLIYALVAYQLGYDDRDKWQTMLTREHNGLEPTQLNLLPIKVVLRNYAATLPAEPDKDKAYQQNNPPLVTLTQFIQQTLDNKNLASAWHSVEDALEKGQAWLLFDGLDEVTNAKQRLYVLQAVQDFVARYDTCRFLVTCRVLSYQKESYQLQDARFETVQLAQFNQKQQADFCEGWYQELFMLQRLSASEAEELTDSLQRGIRRKGLDQLAGLPLLLTVMAIVHTYSRLPDSRAGLYEEAIQVLLWRWELQKRSETAAPDLQTLLREINCSTQDFYDVLAELAFDLHRQRAAMEQNAIVGITQKELYDALCKLHPQNDHGWAQKVVDVMRHRSGLLLEQDSDKFGFPHRTFQEYLAGVHLTKLSDKAMQSIFVQKSVELAADPVWREVVLLAAGYLCHVQTDISKLILLLGELCPKTVVPEDNASWSKVSLAGQLIVDVSQERIIRKGELGKEMVARVRDRLKALITGGHLTPYERAGVGDILATLGDDRLGIAEVDEMELCLVPAGPCWLGDDESGQGRVYEGLDQPYWLARYPVTVGQWRQFVAESGHTPRDKDSLRAPDNRPVIWVNWYDAVEFCAWLNERWQKWLPEGYMVTLPSEAEWEKGARGVLSYERRVLSEKPSFVLAEGLRASLVEVGSQPLPFNSMPQRRYPWGDEPAVEINEGGETLYRANCRSAGIGRVCAVGSFPAGDSPVGCAEMSGQVWEWTRTKYEGSDPTQPDRRQETIDAAGNKDWMVLRGGYWRNDADALVCAVRDRLNPNSSGSSTSVFVCVCVPIFHDHSGRWLSGLWLSDKVA